jgi:hypothetical protein
LLLRIRYVVEYRNRNMLTYWWSQLHFLRSGVTCKDKSDMNGQQELQHARRVLEMNVSFLLIGLIELEVLGELGGLEQMCFWT